MNSEIYPIRSRLTSQLMQALKPDQHVTDTVVSGLTATVSAQGRVIYTLRYTLLDGTRGYSFLGHWPNLTPQQAREVALQREIVLAFQCRRGPSLIAALRRCAELQQRLTEAQANATHIEEADPHSGASSRDERARQLGALLTFGSRKSGPG